MLTDQLILRETGQYDKEIITRLRLERRGLQKISNLDECVSLVELSLPFNEITIISGLSTLTSLKRLDLSFNKIKKIENLHSCIALEYLDLKGNAIASVDDVADLKSLSELRQLHLKGLDGLDANPACKHPAYMSIVMRTLPQLELIDGGHLSICEAFANIEQQLESIKPDPNMNRTPPNEPWFSPEDLTVASKGQPDDYVDLDNDRTFSLAMESHNKSLDMLSEECAHLLRKSQTALSKAGITASTSATTGKS